MKGRREVASSRMRRGGDRLAFTNLKSGGRRRLRSPITMAWNLGSGPAALFRHWYRTARHSDADRNVGFHVALSPEQTTDAGAQIMTQQDPSRPVKPAESARPVDAQSTRQGRSGARILWLLIISGGAAAVLLLGIWFFSQGGLSNTNANDGDQAVDAQAFQGDAATPPAADAPTGPNGETRPAPTGETPNVNAPTAPSN